MTSFEITPTVDETQEFIEIANDFANPLDLVREAISNSFDARATKIEIYFSALQEYGETISLITLSDNGQGMSRDGLQSFFDLGNSLRRGDPNTIGEKGHGTKVYFNSRRIEVTTIKDGNSLHAVMDEPFRNLYNRVIPKVHVSSSSSDLSNRTEIAIRGYNNNQLERFTHDALKDHVLWFTKFGSIESAFDDAQNKDVKLHLKGLDRTQPEILDFGHFFPQDSSSVQQLFERYIVRAPDYYCKQIIKTGSLKRYPHVNYQAIFCIEGTRVKYSYNPMLRRQGYVAPRGAYTVQDRYGVWLCKDFIPIQRKNEWITSRGSEFTRFHAFFNCQEIRLTANRSSVDNTPAEILQDIKDEVATIYNEITESDDWRNIEWLEGEAQAHNTTERERKDFDWRTSKIQQTNIARFKEHVLQQPERESGVFALLVQLALLEPGLFPFDILDYDTHVGYDVIVKGF